MTQLSYANDQREIGVARTLGGLAILTALIAGAAGLVLLITSPDSGSTLESTLGITAAVAGLSTAALAVGTLVYAQIKSLWEHVPNWIRVTSWAILAAAAVFNIVRSITQTS